MYRRAEPMTEAKATRQSLMAQYIDIRTEVGIRYYGPMFRWTNLSAAERAMLQDLTLHVIEWRIREN